MRLVGPAKLLFLAAVVVLSPAASWGISSIAGVICEPLVREKVVALTFDDGPHPVFTPEILDVLDRHQAKATFFVIGREAEKYPDIVKTAAAHGHVIANHTYLHPRNLELATPKQIEHEMDQCEIVIERLTGQRPGLFRPPRGLVNTRVLGVSRQRGYQTVLWSVCADHHDATTPELMARRVVDKAVPGCIILIHDGGTGIRWKDVKATRLIIESLSKKGYTFVTVPELLAKTQVTSRAQQAGIRKPTGKPAPGPVLRSHKEKRPRGATQPHPA